MKRSQKTMISLFMLTLGFVLAASPAQAEAKVTLNPSSLTVVGTQCPAFFKCPPVKRNLLVKTNEVITDLQVITLDLNRADSTTIVPTSAIRLALPNQSVQPKQPLTFPVEFDFNKIRSGEYSGQLLVVYDNGELSVPVIVRLKDHWFFPLLVLLLGVGLGIGVSAYRNDGMPRDEIIVQVGRIRTQIQADPELAQSFQGKIARHLIDVETTLTNKRWDEAQKAVVQAQAVWDKWRKEREDWLALVNYLSELFDSLESLNSNAPYVQEVRSQLENAKRQAADKEATQKFREDLDRLRQQIAWYKQSQAKLDQFNTLRNELTQLVPDKDEFLRRISQGLQNDLDQLSPTDKKFTDDWHQKVNNAIDELDKEIKQQSVTETKDTQITARDANYTTPPTLPNPVPEVISAQTNSKQAARNIYWFNWLSYAIAVGLLAGAGFGQLYANQPMFGANGPSDYFSLLAWGFGAEASRDAIAKVVRDWKLPGLK
ncbi:hypothetical protein IQ247_09040 [Plectonema cf. radiosum LEGE 06105]|uniref:Chromosome segregation ATPase-like protein n=1 Tax=Plectonema cf. radiosum LEGE 06105 TaxID=945769 RepID=A0A8J7F1C6_9CYAN|nr:hypothetical protein [Plectonema radiosum]MBE9212835.1 hypothetical protein [Plectonema cf. radiosum LEGE 06105]